jgi:hypothetical protein
MATLFPDGHRPSVLCVGSSFAIAAAAGGLAHILHNYDPPRLRQPDGEGGDGFKVSFESTLPYPLAVGVKLPAEHEQQAIVLDPDDPFIDDGGKRPIQGLPALATGSHPRMRLIPGGAAGVSARQGRKFRAMRVLQSPGKMEIEWDPAKQRAIVNSDQVEGTRSTLWIDANKLRKRKESALDPYDGPLHSGALAVDAAEDVVLDLGMSKIVALSADRGWVSAEELERVVRDGLDSDQTYEGHGNLQPADAPEKKSHLEAKDSSPAEEAGPPGTRVQKGPTSTGESAFLTLSFLMHSKPSETR